MRNVLCAAIVVALALAGEAYADGGTKSSPTVRIYNYTDGTPSQSWRTPRRGSMPAKIRRNSWTMGGRSSTARATNHSFKVKQNAQVQVVAVLIDDHGDPITIDDDGLPATPPVPVSAHYNVKTGKSGQVKLDVWGGQFSIWIGPQ